MVKPGIVLGLGLGGFLDGILLHQILQWHHLLSDTVDNPVTTVSGLEVNTLADGLFHAATWVLTVAGVWMLWGMARRDDARFSGRSLFGWTLAGWGIFNLVEGVINHQVLQIHHVREGASNEAVWDLAFLALGLLLVIIGMAIRHERRDETNAVEGFPRG